MAAVLLNILTFLLRLVRVCLLFVIVDETSGRDAKK